MQYPVIDLITQAYLNNGWTGLDISSGKNLLNIQPNHKILDNRIEMTSDIGTITFTGTGIFYGVYNIFFDNPIPAGTTVFFSGIKTGTGPVSYRLRDTPSGNNISIALNDTQTPNFDFSLLQFALNPVEYDTTISQLQLEIGSSATPYEPYNPNPSNDFPNRLKLPLPHYFPHPVIDALQRAVAGTQTAEDTEILRHYLTPLGIGGI